MSTPEYKCESLNIEMSIVEHKYGSLNINVNLEYTILLLNIKQPAFECI